MRKSNLQLAITDVVDGLGSVHIWSTLGWQEIVQRYRRSLIGPFWLTISTGVLVGAMGPLYSKLLNQDLGSYFLYLAIGLIIWQTFSQTVSEGCNAFIGAESYIKQLRMPLSIHVMRVLWKNTIVLFHNMVVVVLVMLVFRPSLGYGLLLFPLAVVALAINGLWVCVLFGMVCARFRDIPLIVANIMQLGFFVTPIMWSPGMLGRHAWVVNFNPFYHLLEIARAPLMGAPASLLSWGAVAAMAVIGCSITLAFYSRFRARIAYWV